jgi:septal ring-binding cell division protein DamX
MDQSTRLLGKGINEWNTASKQPQMCLLQEEILEVTTIAMMHVIAANTEQKHTSSTGTSTEKRGERARHGPIGPWGKVCTWYSGT